ncbi:MAG: hypothetical protein KOO63_00985 [Bacteroidales bacterium]|nr:hypothetical protein [Candidatus Latescibacterota bacterium]
MKSKFFIPAATVIVGVLVWVAFLLLCEKGKIAIEQLKYLGVGFSLVVAGLMVYSGFSCRQVGGPRYGNIIRTAMLIIMAAITYWRIDIIPAVLLAAGTIFTIIFALMSELPDASEESSSTLGQAENKTD